MPRADKDCIHFPKSLLVLSGWYLLLICFRIFMFFGFYFVKRSAIRAFAGFLFGSFWNLILFKNCLDELLLPKRRISLSRSSNVFVFPEHSLFDTAIWQFKSSFSLLHTGDPIAFVNRAITPIHLSITMALVFIVISLEQVTTFPSESPKPVFHIIEECSVILVAICPFVFLPLTLSMFKTISEFSKISCSTWPFILSKSTRLTVSILTRIKISILKYISTLPMLKGI